MTRFRKGTVFLGRYVLLGPIGRGSVCVVYEADDTLNARRVAIKLLEQEHAGSATARDRVLHPAAVMTQLRDPGVPRLYEFGDAPLGDGSSIAYAVMDLLTGESLDRRLARGPLAALDAVSIAATVADLLTLAHAQGIVLGAIRPSSILLTSAGAKIIDFDAAGAPSAPTVVEAAPPRLGRNRTSADAPAQPAADASLAVAAADDVYALGALLYEMVTGIAPTTAEALTAEVGQPAALVELWRRCLTHPARRPDAATAAFELWALLTPGALAGPTYAPARPEQAPARHEHTLAQYEQAPARHEHTLAQYEQASARHEYTLARHEQVSARQEHTLARHEHTPARDEHPSATYEHPRARHEHPPPRDEHPSATYEHPRARHEHPPAPDEYAQAPDEQVPAPHDRAPATYEYVPSSHRPSAGQAPSVMARAPAMARAAAVAHATAAPAELETQASVLARVARHQAAAEQAAQARAALARAALDRSPRSVTPASLRSPAENSLRNSAENRLRSRAENPRRAPAEEPPRLAAEITMPAATAAHDLAAHDLAARERTARERAARERARAERERAEWIGLTKDSREHPDRRHSEGPQPIPVGYVGQGGRHRRRRPAWTGPTSQLPVG